jgi:hypothetical protein
VHYRFARLVATTGPFQYLCRICAGLQNRCARASGLRVGIRFCV